MQKICNGTLWYCVYIEIMRKYRSSNHGFDNLEGVCKNTMVKMNLLREMEERLSKGGSWNDQQLVSWETREV